MGNHKRGRRQSTVDAPESSHPISPPPRFPESRVYIIAAVMCAVVCILYVVRQFVTSGFDLVVSDLGDGRLYITILEHWTRVFRAQAPMASPSFFYPEQDVLGYSDALFLHALPYSIVRLLGFDRYLALEFTLVAFVGLSYTSMLLLLRRVLGLGWVNGIGGAALFAISSAICLQLGHVQLIAVGIAPLLFVVAAEYWRASYAKQRKRAVSFVTLLAALMALLPFSAFYIGWFTFLLATAFLFFWAVWCAVIERRLHPLKEAASAFARRKWDLALGVAVSLITLIPFVVVYLPVLKRTGGRGTEDALHFMPMPLDVFNVGTENLFWGWLAGIVSRSTQEPNVGAERMIGMPLITLLVFLVSTAVCVYMVIRGGGFRSPAERQWATVASAAGLSCIALWAVTIKTASGATLWTLVWRIVPGAAAIRAPGRIALVLCLGVATVCSIGVELIRSRLGPAKAYIASILMLALVVEQLSSHETHRISRSEEAARFGKIRRPPAECTTFYAVNGSANPLERQTDAMLIAEAFQVPTMNGYSGWSPAGWNLRVATADAPEQAQVWATSQGVTGRLCELNLDSGQWWKVQTEKARKGSYRIGEMLPLDKPDSNKYLLEGWAPPESGFGRWMVGHRSEMILDVGNPPNNGLVLRVDVSAFVKPQRPSLITTVLVNGTQVAAWRFDRGMEPTSVEAVLPKETFPNGILRISFVNDDARSPAELHVSQDSRLLSLVMRRFVLVHTR